MKKFIPKIYNTRKFINFAYIIIISFIFIGGSAIFSLRSASEIEKDYVDFMTGFNSQVKDNLNIVVKEVERLSTLHIWDQDINNILGVDYVQDSKEYYNDMYYLQNVIMHARSSNQLVWDIVFARKNGDIFSTTSLSPTYKTLLQKWSQELEQSEAKRFVSNIYKMNLNTTNQEFFTIVKKIYDVNAMQKVGYIYINLDYEKLRSKFDEISNKNKKANFLIVDGDKVIYNSNKKDNHDIYYDDLIGKIKKNEGKEENNIFKMEVDNEKYIFVWSQEEITGWKIIQYTSTSNIRQNIIGSMKSYFGIMMILSIIAIFAGRELFKKINSSIEQLQKAMEKIEMGEFVIIDEQQQPQDEFAMLIKRFNRMSKQLRESIQKTYLSEVRQRKIELKMLQAQINPHFLYNTLNLISSIASIENVKPIVLISDSLSQMFRYNIKGNDIVEVKDEVEQINKYITIQQLRFPEKFTVEYDIDKELLHCKILKFLLQPLVENAIYHGFENVRGKRKLYINIKKVSTKDFKIIVKDNGKGIDEKKLDELQNKLTQTIDKFFVETENQNIGILNVHYRIREYYGKNYGLTISGEKDKLTTVTLQLPMIN